VFAGSSLTSSFEFCLNDDSVSDSYYDTCSSWYDASPDDCGYYDDDDFVAATACCACGGGNEVTEEEYNEA
jgi:hypothetical protein